ncbi:hypothetical protein Peur_031412 [Populus x canadensis]
MRDIVVDELLWLAVQEVRSQAKGSEYYNGLLLEEAVVLTNPSRYSFKLVILAKRTMLDVALLLQSDCRLLQALPSICEIPALIQLIPWQETPSNEGNTSIHYAKQDLLEQATEEQQFLNPQSLSVSSVEQGVATSQNLKDQSSEKHSSNTCY